MKKKNIELLFQALDQSIPDPQSDLRFENNFELLISVILSAQATDISVNKVTPALFGVAPTPEAMVALGEDQIRYHIRTIGLYNSKAKNVFNCCRKLVESYNSQVPRTREELESLAGVGRKTAGVVLNIAFDEAAIPVDTHVFRIANRTGLVKAKNPLATEQALLKVVPKWVLKKAHHLLILHGRYVCKARSPECQNCCLLQYCEFSEKNLD